MKFVGEKLVKFWNQYIFNSSRSYACKATMERCRTIWHR